MTTKDDYQCTNVETPNCFMEEKIINDVTCTNSVARGIRAPRMTAMVQRVLFVQESRLRTATTSQERSKWRYAKLMCTGTARSSPTSSHSLLKSRLVLRKRRSTATPRTARSSRGRFATNARRSLLDRFVRCRRGLSVCISPRRNAREEVQLHQGLQGAAEGDLRPMREEIPQTGLRDAGEVGVRVQAQGGMQGRGQAVLPQGGEGCAGRSLRYEVRYFILVTNYQ